MQVRATSADGDSEWSSSGTGLTHPPEVTVDSDFLLPAGLGAGTKFRLLYVSDGQKWNRSPIGRYNDWVKEFAAAGHDKILAYAPGFRAVGCDSRVNARVNTGTQWSTSDRGVPIHWLGGPIAADDYGDFYDGSWQNEDAPRTEAGEPKPVGFDGVVFTGCNDDGTTSTGFPLGAESSTHGKLDSSNAGDGPLSSNFALKANRPIYGLSQVFVVGGGTDADGAGGGVHRAPDPVLIADERGQSDVARHVQRARDGRGRGRGGLRDGRHVGGGRGDDLGVRRDRVGGRSGGPQRHGDAFVRERPGHRRHGRQRAVGHRADGRQRSQLRRGQRQADGDDHGSGDEFGAVRGDVRLLGSGERLRAGPHRCGQRHALGLRGSGRGYVLHGGDRADRERPGDGGRRGERGDGRGGQRQHGGRAGHVGLHGLERTAGVRRDRPEPDRGGKHGERHRIRPSGDGDRPGRRPADVHAGGRGRRLLRHRRGDRPACARSRRWTTRRRPATR